LYNLDDIEFDDTVYQEEDYFYCVAYVADHEYMYGFPRETSPFCRGKFCGANQARYSELVESLYRVIRPYILSDYTVNRSDISTRVEEQQPSLSIEQLATIAQGVEQCGEETCQISSLEQMDMYVRYCTSNLQACNLVKPANFAQGAWPT
jgi:hypothetical protein